MSSDTPPKLNQHLVLGSLGGQSHPLPLSVFFSPQPQALDLVSKSSTASSCCCNRLSRFFSSLQDNLENKMKERQMREIPAFSAEAPRRFKAWYTLEYTLLLSVFSCFFPWVALAFAFGLLAALAFAFGLQAALAFAFGPQAALAFAFGPRAAVAFAFALLAALAFAFGLQAALVFARALALAPFGPFGAAATDLIGIMLENQVD